MNQPPQNPGNPGGPGQGRPYQGGQGRPYQGGQARPYGGRPYGGGQGRPYQGQRPRQGGGPYQGQGGPQQGQGQGQNKEEVGTPITCTFRGDFAHWMIDAKGSIVISTYQAGKIAMVGWNGNQVSIVMRHFAKPMGMATEGNKLAIATRGHISILANSRPLANDYLPDQRGRYDALFIPRLSYVTGELQTHDLAFGKDGLWAVNTRFGCLCQLSDEYNFIPKWHPPFLTQLAPEDRCHLNGLALVDGKPKYVTALGETDSVGAWREKKATGGILMDVESNEIIVRGLSMPHSPRWYDGKLWVLNSGTGELCTVDTSNGQLTPVAALPGFTRGMSFHGDFAIIGLSKIREKHIFSGLPVSEKYDSLKCGAAVVNIRTGANVGLFEFTGGCNELYEVLFLPGIMKPNILNHEREETQQAVTAPDFAYWIRPSNVIQDDNAAQGGGGPNQGQAPQQGGGPGQGGAPQGGGGPAQQ